MKTTSSVSAVMKVMTVLALLLLGEAALAQDAWLSGRALFSTHCTACHTTTAKAGSSVGDITNAISVQPCMNGSAPSGCAAPGGAARNLTGLTSGQIADLSAYLGTPRHGSLSPLNHGFPGTAVDAAANPTHTFTLSNDGDSSRTGSALLFSGVNASGNTNFSLNVNTCTGTLPAGSSCTVILTFNPQSVQPPGDPDFSTTFNVGHNGFNSLSAATASGRGLKNLEITTASLPPFTATRPNTSGAQTVMIANRLGSTLRLCLENTSTFPASGDFNLVGRTYDSGPGRCATVANPVGDQNITFTPSEDGPRLARFTAQRISGGVPVGPVEFLNLEGNVGPFLSISGAGLTGNALFSGVRQDVNAGAAPVSVLALRNAGNATLRVSSLTVALVPGAGSPEYTLSGCGVGTQITQGGLPCDLSVSFDPVDVGARTTTLLIGYSDVADTPASQRTAVINLQGEGRRGAGLIVRDALGAQVGTGSSEAFGSQNLHITYRRRLVLHNVGTDEGLEVSAPSFVPGSAAFTLVPGASSGCSELPAGFTLPANGRCEVEVRFAPTAVGSYGTSLTLATRPVGAATAPVNFVLNLSGAGVDGRPVLAWQSDVGAPISLVELPGMTAVGTPVSPQVSLRLANPGPGAAALQLLNIVGTDASSFVVAGPAPGRCEFGDTAALLLEGASCAVLISFTPQIAGAKVARLQLVSTGSTPPPLEIRAQSSGPASVVALNAIPASMHLNEVRVGAQSLPATVTLSNGSLVPLVVTSITSSPGFSVVPGSCGALPLSMLPDSSCTLSVRFEPGSVGEASGILRVQVSGLAQPVDVALRGTGTPAADVSGGGCSISNGQSMLDPTLWSLVMLAAAVLYLRRRRSVVSVQDSQHRP